MTNFFKRPATGSVSIDDSFWTPYLNNVQSITIPHCFNKFEEKGVDNFISVGEGKGEIHQGPPWTDGLVLETMRAACDFLSCNYDEKLAQTVDRIAKLVCSAADTDSKGYLSTFTMQNYPHLRWGENGGDLLWSHDIYNMGTLIEAAISHYNATKETFLLKRAVKVANNICSYIGEPPKHRIIPGHSLAEEAFVKLYCLFKDDESLKAFAEENNVNYADYLEVADFWYRRRGTGVKTNHDPVFISKCDHIPNFNAEYFQNHLPFEEQKTAVGHSVRATLCYLGAAAVAIQTGNQKYIDSLNAIWHNITDKKVHITGGVGTRHDIEGFDKEYLLPNEAYLETCAGIGLAFMSGEMSLIDCDSKFFDCFELSLYNNILGALEGDFKHFFYQNPLRSDGKLKRWEWEGCPCCPPMLVKMFSSLHTYIYSFSEDILNINMLIGSKYENESFAVSQKDGKITVDSKGKEITLRIRIPVYAKNFKLLMGGKELDYATDKGYAVIKGILSPRTVIEAAYGEEPVRIIANTAVEDDLGLVCVMRGRFIMCAEGIDNNGIVDITVAENPQFKVSGDRVIIKNTDGEDVTLIPYYQWCNRHETEEDGRMAVWFKQDKMLGNDAIDEIVKDKLYYSYEKALNIKG